MEKWAKNRMDDGSSQKLINPWHECHRALTDGNPNAVQDQSIDDVENREHCSLKASAI